MTAPDETTATLVQAVVADARRLGLTWTIRPATVTSTDGGAVTATYDGDTVPIPMVSLAPFVPAVGRRVWAVAVPPAGDYVIGPVSSVAGANVATGGAVAATAGAEVAVATWLREPTLTFVAGRVYRIGVSFYVFDNTSTLHKATVRVRKGSASTTGQVLALWGSDTIPGVGSSGFAKLYQETFVQAVGTSVQTPISLTIEKVAGAGSVGLYGDGASPLTMVVEDVGDAVSMPDISSFAAVVT